MSRILGLDLGTKTGWALQDNDKLISGEADFSLRRSEGEGMKAVKFRLFLDAMGDIDTIYFEEVKRHAGTYAAHAYGGFRMLLLEWIENHHIIRYRGIGVGTVKKFATGKGNSGKDLMIRAAQERWPEQQVKDNEDNRADALWILRCGIENVGL